MESHTNIESIALIGGGPAALFMMLRLVQSGRDDVAITIFEKSGQLGAGMPYSEAGSGLEHITNVSGNEIPGIVTTMKDWVKTAPNDLLDKFDMEAAGFNDFKVVPRLLFGAYLEAQFNLLLAAAGKKNIPVKVRLNTTVRDVKEDVQNERLQVYTGQEQPETFDRIIMCMGHTWPKKLEGHQPGWYDCPYPTSKLEFTVNGPVAIKGASLTAIDAMRTLARQHGHFIKNEDGTLAYHLDNAFPDFRMVMHSLYGLLPALRFHLEDTHLTPAFFLEEKDAYRIKDENAGFIPLDLLYQKNFIEPLQQQHPELYAEVKNMALEEFVDYMMNFRERLDAFDLLKGEYREAERSIRRQESVSWKENLAALSYAMNYPAKHFSAEDMLRLKKVLMPLISIVIAFVPQSSCREMMALHEAGVLRLQAVDNNSKVEPADDRGAVYHYKNKAGDMQSESFDVFIDAIGQPPMMFNDFPFKSLLLQRAISAARLRFKDSSCAEEEMNAGNPLVTSDGLGNYYLDVPGISINDHFQVLDRFGVANERIYIMAVPFIGGLNPDYSGLDFCETASKRIVENLFKKEIAEV
ncbi:MAG: FAD/NAD(P)-binding protein [Ferruginibacter sp.]